MRVLEDTVYKVRFYETVALQMSLLPRWATSTTSRSSPEGVPIVPSASLDPRAPCFMDHLCWILHDEY